MPPAGETIREKSRLRKQRQRERTRERHRLAAIAEAEQLERDILKREVLDEYAAPAIMRCPILMADGHMLLGPRVQVIDGCPARVDPVAALKLTARQRRAGRQLAADWREVGAGISMCAVDWMRGSHGEGLGGHAAIRRQIDTRQRLEGVLAFLGAFAPLVARVVMDCIPLSVWAEQAGRTHDQAIGWLSAALDRAALFYWPQSPGRLPTERILTIGPPRSDYAVDIHGTNVVADSATVAEM